MPQAEVRREVLNVAENQKKSKYATACKERQTSFPPIYYSVDGIVGSEAEIFLKRLAGKAGS